MRRIRAKLSFYWKMLPVVVRSGAYMDFLDFLIYRTPLRVWWARSKGHRFHKSTLFWFQEQGDIHTRMILLLPRLRSKYPELKSVSIELEFYDESGRFTARKKEKGVGIDDIYILESNRLPADLRIPAPFSGTLIAKVTLDLADREVWRIQNGLFASFPTFIDYYAEGDFVTTVHDYNAFLPDQGINEATLGMIPAYCDSERETFLLFHSAAAGIGGRDLRVILLNAAGQKRERWFSGLKPFALKRAALTELFPDARDFLGGSLGQIHIEGFWRQLLRRTAFGVQYPGSKAFSIDHCLYADYERLASPPRGLGSRPSKTIFSPFLFVEDEHTTTSAIVYQSRLEKENRHADLLLYDEAGRCVANLPDHIRLSGDRVVRVDIRKALESRGIATPLIGHAELVFHRQNKDESGGQPAFEHAVEYRSGGRVASVLHGADFWNSPEPIRNDRYFSVNRIVCNDAQTTYMAISNCSYDLRYDLTVPFRLSLICGGRAVASGEFTIGPNATLYQPIEYFFPDAAKLLEPTRGVGLSAISHINCDYLTNAFLTEDRQTRALSVEHSFPY